MNLYLKIWRQESSSSQGEMKNYQLEGVSQEMSFLEMLDYLNLKIAKEGGIPIEFDHDCREGICGQCGIMINGIAHGHLKQVTTCQLHMRSFKDGDTIYIEPFRSSKFRVIRDLKIDRSSLDRIIESGGYISINTGMAPEANTVIITNNEAEAAFDAAACIGCGACIATCKNSSAALFTAAKVTHLVQLPQGKKETAIRVMSMVNAMEKEGFGHCSNTEACEVECPQGISVLTIARMNYEYNKARLVTAK